MFDLITLGNATIDLYFQGKTLTYKNNRFQLAVGGKYVVDHFQQTVGGGALNVAIGVSKSGLTTSLISIVGEHIFKEKIISTLKENHVNTNHLITHPPHIKISSILLNDSGERSILTYESHHESYFKFPSFKLETFLKAKFFYMANITNMSIEEKSKILHFLKTNNVFSFVSMGVADCRKKYNTVVKLLRDANAVILNTHEFSELIHRDVNKINFKNSILKYVPNLEDKLWIITDGENGSYAYEKSHVLFQKAKIINHIIDTTGAGDAYTAGFIGSYIKNKDVQQAMISGSEYSSKIISKIGAN